jgi:hypothetical protein
MLDQVIDLEVQDVVPFELDGFSVQHCALGQFYRSEGNAALADPSAAYDIHVGIMPRTLVSNVLTLCKSVGIEPNILTVPSSALASIYHLGKNFFSGNSAIILCRNDEYALAAHINGQVRVEKTIRDGTILQAASGSGTSSDKRAVYTAIKLLIAAAERRYGSSIDKLFFLDADTPDAALQQILGRPLEALSSAEFLAPGSKGSGLAALSAVFARDDEPAAALSNFRAREFSFTPTLTEFFRALLGAKRQVVNAVVSVLVCVAGVYLAREYNITESRSALIEQVRAVIPDFNPGEGDIRAALIRAETKLSEDLGVLGPIAKVTPLDALLEIIRVLPTDGITITSVKVTGTRAFIQGTAPKLGAIEAVGDALRGSKEFFSKVTASPGTSVGSRFNFSIEVVLGQ